MKLTGVHLLMTYRCTRDCDHCFVWGSPEQRGTMPIESIKQILEQARDLGTVDRIYFEGGEPFQFYAVLLSGVRAARCMGLRVGVVSESEDVFICPSILGFHLLVVEHFHRHSADEQWV